ncbi:F0F1 ATP synthase subunit gamma [Simiduia litorea]
MKAVAAASIGDYERAVAALGDYYTTVERGLGACFHDRDLLPTQNPVPHQANPTCIIVFGTDQGLVGQFNDVIAEFTVKSLASREALDRSSSASLSAQTRVPTPSASTAAVAQTPPSSPLVHKPLIWAVGERINERLIDSGLTTQARFDVPSSVQSITFLIADILFSIETKHAINALTEVYLFFNRPSTGAGYLPISQRLLPLDQTWCTQLAEQVWPSNNIPEVLADKTGTLGALIQEYLFVSLFRASAESLSSENASRLAAMHRADKNIEELLTTLNRNYQRLRQAGIDEEMFDVIAGSNI